MGAPHSTEDARMWPAVSKPNSLNQAWQQTWIKGGAMLTFQCCGFLPLGLSPRFTVRKYACFVECHFNSVLSDRFGTVT